MPWLIRGVRGDRDCSGRNTTKPPGINQPQLATFDLVLDSWTVACPDAGWEQVNTVARLGRPGSLAPNGNRLQA